MTRPILLVRFREVIAVRSNQALHPTAARSQAAAGERWRWTDNDGQTTNTGVRRMPWLARNSFGLRRLRW